MAIVGKDGKIAAMNVGNLGDLEKRMKTQLDALIAGKPVPTFASAQPPQRKRPALELVGKKAPSFSIKTIDGKPLGDSDFANHPATVLNFVAPNCGFCKRQIPNVEKIRQEYEAKGVRFVNVAQKMRKDYTTEETVKVFEGVGSKLELATEFTNTVGGLYKATSYPTMMVVDSSGKIRHVNIGAKADLDKLVKGQLDALIK
ncbi:MAG: TlpA family protein disulfide reductase [Phycisphaerae bacterium]